MEDMDWFTASIFSLLCIVCYRLFLKYFLSKEGIVPTAFSILEAFVAIFICIFFVIVIGFKFTGGAGEILVLIIKSFGSGAAALLLVTSLKHIAASEYQILSSSRIFLTIFTGFVFFEEKIDFIKIISAVLVLISIMLIAIRKKKIKLNKYHGFGFSAALIFGLVFTADKYISEYFNTFTMLLLTFIFSQIFKFFATPSNFKLVPKVITQKKYIFPTMITGSLLAGIYLFQYYAYQKDGDLSTVNIIKGTSTVFIVIFSTIFLNDKEIAFRKILAAFTASAALIMTKVL